MLVSAILSATISYHSFFTVAYVSYVYAQMRQLTVLKLLTKLKLFPQCNFRMLALCLALLFKLGSYCFIVSSYPLSDITVYMPISSTHACKTRAPEFHVTL